MTDKRHHGRDRVFVIDDRGGSPPLEVSIARLFRHADRSMHELRDPKRKDVRRIYENEFAAMSIEDIAYRDLIAAREKLIETLKKELTDDQKTFLVSIKSGEPN